MCGIVGYVGHRSAVDVVIKGLMRLEYRGYDSSGISVLRRGKIETRKKKGRVSEMASISEGLIGGCGIGHTRWATHGEPNDVNAHPHVSGDGNISLVHNGIIENYASLRQELESRGYVFRSQTDTEVLVHLIDDVLKSEGGTLATAIRTAMSSVIGAYAIAAVHSKEPNKIVVARLSSPLCVGVGDGELLVASDASAIVEYTNQVFYLDDGDVVILDLKKGMVVKGADDKKKKPYLQTLEMRLDEIEKGGYPHFMLKEIYEQPKSVRDCLRGRILHSDGLAILGGLRDYEHIIANSNRIILVACGTSWHACLVAEYLIEEFARINVEVEYASEFRYRNPILSDGDVLFAVSQSGETADTLAAIELAKLKGIPVFGICNVVGSSIARTTDAGSYTHAGPEIGVASTKAFTAQVTVLTLLALRLAILKNTMDEMSMRRLLVELDTIPDKISRVLLQNDNILDIAKLYKDAKSSLYLGRGISFPVALEGALKLKEISYIHAEGYPAAEMKHGPIALIDENMPVFVIATKGSNYEKVVSNIQEVKARKGKIIAVVTEGDKQLVKMADHLIEIPETDEYLSTLLSTIPMQLLSYHIAVMRGCDVDRPRNLAKSVTVE